MVSYMDYTSPTTQYAFDVNTSHLFIKNPQNYINILGVQQLNSLENVSLLDIFLSSNNIVEPHYHQNAAELVYCISGAAVVSMLNPFTNQLLSFSITPGKVVNIPQGWWHYEIATMDNTHLLAIFDAPTPQVILGSDILKFTPATIMSYSYCMNEDQWKHTTASVTPKTYIGPSNDCSREIENHSDHYPYSHYQQAPFYQSHQQVPYATHDQQDFGYNEHWAW